MVVIDRQRRSGWKKPTSGTDYCHQCSLRNVQATLAWPVGAPRTSCTTCGKTSQSETGPTVGARRLRRLVCLNVDAAWKRCHQRRRMRRRRDVAPRRRMNVATSVESASRWSRQQRRRKWPRRRGCTFRAGRGPFGAGYIGTGDIGRTWVGRRRRLLDVEGLCRILASDEDVIQVDESTESRAGAEGCVSAGDIGRTSVGRRRCRSHGRR